MDTLIKADVFFFITSVAVVILIIISIFAGYYLVQILRNFRDISDKLKKAVDLAEDDMESIHDKIVGSWLFNLIFHKKSKSKKTAKK